MSQCNPGTCPLNQKVEELSDEVLLLLRYREKCLVQEMDLDRLRHTQQRLIQELKRLGGLLSGRGCDSICSQKSIVLTRSPNHVILSPKTVSRSYAYEHASINEPEGA